MKLGSEEHKQLFCHSFIDTHIEYEPEKLPWPDLDEESLKRLKGIPFWTEALITEKDAGVMVSSFAETIEDPLIKKAIALQGREEERHGRLIEYLIKYYDIELKPIPETVISHNIEDEFITFGFTECLDSFFAFGMFGIARQAKFLPDPFFRIFDPILDEEARHIVFFVNWVTYLKIKQGKGWTPLRGVNTLISYIKAIRSQIQTFTSGEEGDQEVGNSSFTFSEAGHFREGLTPKLFFATCLEENHHRMKVFDQNLLQPMLMPRISSIAYNTLKLLPSQG
jgi:hypothetical protein